MSRNYDNWERLVAAEVKKEQIWQLCHQDSISTISSDYSCRLEFNLTVWLGSSNRITETFEFLRRLRERSFTTTDLVGLVQDVQLSDQQYLATGTKAVIKSLNSVEITEDEFEQHMIVLGNCSHANVATPWAYYFSETTKIIVYDYYNEGSVFDMLQGDHSSLPNWESRVRIAVGAARGIAHIHAQCEGKLFHGNIKSSNIFLNPQRYGCVSDFGMWGAGFKRPSQEGDVYSFGELLLELVTWNSMGASFLARHIHSSPTDKQRFVDELDILFPKFLYSEPMESAVQQELWRTLPVARRCLSLIREERPRMCDVVLELEKMYSRIERPNTPWGQQQGSSNNKAAVSVWHRFLHFRR